MTLLKALPLLCWLMLLAACGPDEHLDERPTAADRTAEGTAQLAPPHTPTAAATATTTPSPSLVRLVIFDEPE